MYFLTSLWGSARERASHIAMVLGLVLGPVLHRVVPGFDLLAAGARRRHRLCDASHAQGRGHDARFHRRVVVALSVHPVGGWAVTYPFRVLGVYLGGRIREDSDILVLVRAVATALVAAVIGNLICFPTGAAADSTLALRIGAAASVSLPISSSAATCLPASSGRKRSSSPASSRLLSQRRSDLFVRSPQAPPASPCRRNAASAPRRRSAE